MRFVDTNIFVYVITAHPKFGEASKKILERIEKGEKAFTSFLVLLEVAWTLEAMGRQGDIKSTLDKILSYKTLAIENLSLEDLLVGAGFISEYKIDFNDGINLAIMQRKGTREVYSNDKKHLGKIETIELIF
jgi:predicted nucleic acid-binding protein